MKGTRQIEVRKERTHFSFFSRELSISVEVPADWDVVNSEDFPLALLRKEDNDFRVNVGFNVYKFSGSEQAQFTGAIKSTKKVLESEYKDYQFISEEHGWLDGFPSYLQAYSWSDDENDKTYFQILCLVNVIPERLYEITATSLLKDQEEIEPTLDEIINSFRYIEMN